MIDFVASTLGDFAKSNPEHKDEMISDARPIKLQKLGEHEVEIEKIIRAFLLVLKDIKSILVRGKRPAMWRPLNLSGSFVNE